MKKFLLLAILVLAVFLVYNRQRLYVRDPLGSVMHDDMKENGVQVFINYSSDVLLENDNQPRYVTIIQHDNHIGTPKSLLCIHWLVCLADADVVPLLQPMTGAMVETMTNKMVSYRTAKEYTVVMLR